MDDRKIIGFCLEFYRMTKEDNRVIPVDEFLCFDGIPYCHKNTYRKIVAGENEKKEMYFGLLQQLQMKYEMEEQFYPKLLILHEQLKHAVEQVDRKQLIVVLSQIKDMLTKKENVYPYQINRYLVDCLERFIVFDEVWNNHCVKVLLMISRVCDTPMRLLLNYYLYQNCHRSKRKESSLKKMSEQLLVSDHEELLNQLILMRQMIYEQEFTLAEHLAECAEKICLASGNQNRMVEVLQCQMAIYGVTGREEQAKDCLSKLEQLMKEESLDPIVVKQCQYYLGMHHYSEHNFVYAGPFLKQQIQGKKPNKNNCFLFLFYESVLNYERKKDPEIGYSEVDLQNLDSTQRRFLQYFLYQRANKSRNYLVSYIMKRILPLLNSDHAMEAYVFLQELYLLKAKEEAKIMKQRMTELNYVIQHSWEKSFS